MLVEQTTAKRLAEIGAEALIGPPKDVATIVGNDRERWGKVIREAGIKPE